MEHDVEAETEGHDEERVPEEEGEEGLEDLDGNGGFQFRKMHFSFKERNKCCGAIFLLFSKCTKETDMANTEERGQ